MSLVNGKILVPVDFSACSTEALRTAIWLAGPFRAQIDLLHVVELPPNLAPDMRVAHVDAAYQQTIAQWARSEAEKTLAQMLEGLDPPFAGQPMIASGFARETILDVAERGGYALIVMGTHGRTGLRHFVAGSVAEQVVRRAVCPVLTVRVPEDEKAG